MKTQRHPIAALRALCVASALLLSSSAAMAQQASTPSAIVPLWKGAAPGAQGTEEADTPRLEVYLPSPAPAHMTAVVVCPGGSYGRQAMAEEGWPAQRYLNSLGVAVYVLRYRVGPKYHHPVELGDAARAIRLVRSRAAEWGLDPARIGIMGFSAGGHLASSISTHFDTGRPDSIDPIDHASSRPDFAILVYPVITMSDPWTHQGSRRNLLGTTPDTALIANLSNERQVTPQTPPTFLVHGFDDRVVPVENSLQYYDALRKAGVKSELHVYQDLPHGSGMGGDNPMWNTWPPLLTNWLRENGFVAVPK